LATSPPQLSGFGARLARRQPRPARWQKLLTNFLAAELASWICFFAEQCDRLLAVGYR
jgi:hypothetical protein